MARNVGHSHPQPADPGQGRLHGRQKLRFHLSLDLTAAVALRHIPAHILIKKQRIGDPEGIGSVAPDAHIHVQADIVVNITERNRGGRAVEIVHDLFNIEKIHPLILAGTAAESKTLPQCLKSLLNVLAQIPVKKAGLRGGIVDKLPRLGTEFHYGSLLHNDHKLSFIDSHDGTVGDHIVRSLVAAPAGDPFPAPGHQYVIGQSIAVKILPPLICHQGTDGIFCRSDQSHYAYPPLLK